MFADERRLEMLEDDLRLCGCGLWLDGRGLLLDFRLGLLLEMDLDLRVLDFRLADADDERSPTTMRLSSFSLKL